MMRGNHNNHNHIWLSNRLESYGKRKEKQQGENVTVLDTMCPTDLLLAHALVLSLAVV